MSPESRQRAKPYEAAVSASPPTGKRSAKDTRLVGSSPTVDGSPCSRSGISDVLHLGVIVLLVIALFAHQELRAGSAASVEDLARIASASRLAAEAITVLQADLRPGVTGLDLDRRLDILLAANNATAATLHYGGFTGALLQPSTSARGNAVCGIFDGVVGLTRLVVPSLPSLPLCGFPGRLCISVNSDVCHGIPRREPFNSGDLVKLDVAVNLNGYFGDTCATYVVGDIAAPSARRISEVTREALFLSILAAGMPNATLGDIGYASQAHAEFEGFRIVKEYSGHGVGRNFHEPPNVLHVGLPGKGHRLIENQVITLEPILAEGSESVTILSDGWTVTTRDGQLSAQWEHTVVVSLGVAVVLTARQGETLPQRIFSSKVDRERLLNARYEAGFAAQLDASAERFARSWPTSLAQHSASRLQHKLDDHA